MRETFAHNAAVKVSNFRRNMKYGMEVILVLVLCESTFFAKICAKNDFHIFRSSDL